MRLNTVTDFYRVPSTCAGYRLGVIPLYVPRPLRPFRSPTTERDYTLRTDLRTRILERFQPQITDGFSFPHPQLIPSFLRILQELIPK